MDKKDVNLSLMLSVYADMIIEESLCNFQKKRLYQEIDSALSVGDEEKFLQLTEELNALIRPSHTH